MLDKVFEVAVGSSSPCLFHRTGRLRVDSALEFTSITHDVASYEFSSGWVNSLRSKPCAPDQQIEIKFRVIFTRKRRSLSYYKTRTALAREEQKKTTIIWGTYKIRDVRNRFKGQICISLIPSVFGQRLKFQGKLENRNMKSV